MGPPGPQGRPGAPGAQVGLKLELMLVGKD